MKKNSTSLKIGDFVKVKEGIRCPDIDDLCIGGGQGRVSEIGEDDDGKDLICISWDSISWDSITLKNISFLSAIWRLLIRNPQTIDP